MGESYLLSHSSSRNKSRIAILMISLLFAYFFFRTSSSSPSKNPSGTCTVKSLIKPYSPRLTAKLPIHPTQSKPSHCVKVYICRYSSAITIYKKHQYSLTTTVLHSSICWYYGFLLIYQEISFNSSFLILQFLHL